MASRDVGTCLKSEDVAICFIVASSDGVRLWGRIRGQLDVCYRDGSRVRFFSTQRIEWMKGQ